MADSTIDPRVPASTGIPGLDDVLCGGFTRNRLFLVEGVPGAGKTTLAMQFLMTVARAGETVLYVTLSETEANCVVSPCRTDGPWTASPSGS